MRCAEFVYLFGIESSMYAAKNYASSVLARDSPKFQSAKCVGGVDPDADYIARLESIRTKALQCFITDQRIPIAGRRGSRDDVEPAWCNDADAEGDIARVYQMNAYTNLLVYLLTSLFLKSRQGEVDKLWRLHSRPPAKCILIGWIAKHAEAFRRNQSTHNRCLVDGVPGRPAYSRDRMQSHTAAIVETGSIAPVRLCAETSSV